jgi:sec-independent protein translocase protein TatC
MIITIMAALFAPPDAVSMLLLMAPLIVMYEGAIWVIAWIQRSKARKAEAEAVVAKSEPRHPWEGRSNT